MHSLKLKTRIRSIGNSRDVIVPKPVLAQAGLETETEAELVIEKGAIVLRKPTRAPREGWAEASRRVANAGDVQLAWPEFDNEEMRDLEW